MVGNYVDPKKALQNMRDSNYITAWSPPRNTPTYLKLLKDPKFADEARAIIMEKIKLIEDHKIKYPGIRAEKTALDGWNKALRQVEEALQPSQGSSEIG